MKIHANFLVNSINAERKLCQIKSETSKDVTLSKIMDLINNGWPSKKAMVSDDVKMYYNYKGQLHLIDGIVYKLNSIVI